MSVYILGACAAALIAADPAAGLTPAKVAEKPAAAANVSHTYLGEVTGVVVKVGDDSITLKVPEVVQTGTTRQRSHTPHVPGMSGGHRGSSITVPKLETKMVEVTFDLGDRVSVKTVAGKAMTLSDISVGGAARLHVERVREWKPGEKTEPHVVVKTIDIPVPAAKPAAKK